MGSIKDWLPNAKLRYEEARRLMDTVSLRDPVTQPYKSRYEAATILEDLKEELSQLSDSFSDENPFNPGNLVSVLMRIDLGINCLETEDLGHGERYLESALEFMNDQYRDCPSLVLFKCIVLNQLGYLWSVRGDYEKAAQFLKSSETEYRSWSLWEKKDLLTLELINAFSLDPIKDAKNNNAVSHVEKTCTQTLYFLAQVYEKMNKVDEAAIYCRQTLKRQYESNEFNALDWAMHTATLSQCFATKNDFRTARHLISCSKYVLSNYVSDYGDDDVKLKQGKADLARICVKYCLMLLEASGKGAVPSEEPNNGDGESFLLLNEADVRSIEDSIPVNSVTSFEEARQVFLAAQHWINEAKDYYALNEHASDHVECVQDHSKLFRLLTFFEECPERRYKMHKKRVTLLEGLVKEINPQYFLAQSRQMEFELGETYSEMAEIKIALAEEKSDAELVLLAQRANKLISQAVKHFNNFIDSFRNKSTKELPPQYPDDMVKPIIVAFFNIGRLHSKMFTADSRNKMKNWATCEKYYKTVVEYIEKNSHQKELVREELALLEEMLQLIPGKISLLRSGSQ